MYERLITPERAWIFRMVHLDNVPWILRHGLHCSNSASQDPNYVDIGNESLIDKRSRRGVPIAPGGTLSDYVPFYFTPCSIMMYNIHTGYGGIRRRHNDELVILVSSLRRADKLGLRYLFTNQHAYPVDTEFFDDLNRLDQIDWSILQRRDFKTDDADPGKQQRYHAEALIHRHLPLAAVLGVACHSGPVREKLESLVAQSGLDLSVKSVPAWYFD